MFRFLPFTVLSVSLLVACGDSNTDSASSPANTADTIVEVPAPESATETKVKTNEPVAETVTDNQEAASSSANIQAEANGVESEIKQEVATAEETVNEIVETVIADVGDKPYSISDGKISENAMEGWRTYNGGGCGACHGKGGIGAVGPNLANSVANKLSQEEFNNIVINGVSGTMMRPHKTNKRVMDNLDKLYIYLLARGDGVLGPGNLIKSPLGK